jgi:alkylation response protein AidB-like acyl-CoA dehydrogenase
LIDFSMNEAQLAIQKIARDFAQNEIKPLAAEIDKISDPSKSWNWEIYTKANQLGYNKILIPQAYGGLGLTTLDAVIVIEEISVADAGIGTSYFVHNANARIIDDGCTDEQKQEFLTPCCNDPEDRYFIAIAETERGVTRDLGTDSSIAMEIASDKVGIADFFTYASIPMAMQNEVTTYAKQDGDHWIINGTKHFITFGSRAKLYMVLAKTDPELPDLSGVSSFFVPTGIKGLSFGHIEDKMGHRSTENAEIILDDCRVPDRWRFDSRINIMKRGSTLNVLCAAVAVGLARRAFEEAIAYAQMRYKSGSRIIFKQSVQRMLTDMAINVKTARLITWQAAYLDEQAVSSALSSMAKVYAAEAAIGTSLLGMQVFGGYGYMRDLPMEKLYRDARLMSIYDGTNEILRHLLIAPAITIEGTA